MSEPDKLTPPDAASGDEPKKLASLFERADAAFDLENGLNRVAVPRNLPAAKARSKPAAKPQTKSQTEPQVTPPPASEEAHVAPPADPAPMPPKHQHQQEVSEQVQTPIAALTGPRVQIDRHRLKEAGLIVPEERMTGLLEEFRIVKRELLADARANATAAGRRILVSSPHPGEGKTYCAINLAIALAAERDMEVVLVDADVLNPSVARRFGVEPAAGLMDALAMDQAGEYPEIEQFVSPTDIDGLYLLQSGTAQSHASEVLNSVYTAKVLQRLTQGAANRIVIFDTPPALSASPAAELAGHVGQVLLVVRADQTSRAALDDARQLLSSCRDIKLVLNAARFSPSGRRFGDYGDYPVHEEDAE